MAERITFYGVIFLAFGLLFIFVALREWRMERRRRAVGQRTDGIVTRLRPSGRYWCPVFAFQTSDGRTLEVESRTGTSPPSYHPGEAVRVLYDPAHPENARIDRAAFGAGRIAFFSAVGILFAGVGAGLLVPFV